MSMNDWRGEEIQNLKAQKETLEQREEIENIWKRAFSDPEEGWRLYPRIEEIFREQGFVAFRRITDHPTGLQSGYTAAEEIQKFKHKLVIGACEYLTKYLPSDNRITARRIFHVLRRGKEFGHFISADLIHQWISGGAEGFNQIVADFAIDKDPHSSIHMRYTQAIRKWWRDHPGDKPPTQADIGHILGITQAAISSKMLSTPSLKKLMEKRPDDV